MSETTDFLNGLGPVLFWASWLVLLYLAWPRLTAIARDLFRGRPAGKPVRLRLAPLRPNWDLAVEQGLQWATWAFLGLSGLEILLRAPQLERYSLPVFALCLGLTLLIRGWRSYFRPSEEKSEIVFPQVMNNTAIGMGLLRVQAVLGELRDTAAALDRQRGHYREVAGQLREFIEAIRVFLVGIRLEPFDSPLLRQAQPLFIRLETLATSFALLAQLSDQAELRKVSAQAVEILTQAKSGFAALQTAQDKKLLDQLDVLISVLRHLYKSNP